MCQRIVVTRTLFSFDSGFEFLLIMNKRIYELEGFCGEALQGMCPVLDYDFFFDCTLKIPEMIG